MDLSSYKLTDYDVFKYKKPELSIKYPNFIDKYKNNNNALDFLTKYYELKKYTPKNYQKTNTGEIGIILFKPKVYSNDMTNDYVSAVSFDIALKNNNNIDEETKQKLNKVFKNKDIAFGNGAQVEEVMSITQKDADLLLEYVEKINNNELVKKGADAKNIELRKYLAEQELEFRKDYFELRSESIDPKTIKSERILEVTRNEDESDTRLIEKPESSVGFLAKKWYNYKYWNYRYEDMQAEQRENGRFIGFETVDSKGVNIYTSDGKEIDIPSRVLAEYGVKVSNDLSTTTQCFTGLKHTLLSSGVISDYADIKDENGKMISTPRRAVEWFANQPDKFTEIKYVRNEDGTVREINSTDIYNLPAGYIVLQIPEEGKEFENEAGHAGTTNGNKQLEGDHSDSFRWEYFPKGEHGTIRVFKLNEKNWAFNDETQKLEFSIKGVDFSKDDRNSNINYAIHQAPKTYLA